MAARQIETLSVIEVSAISGMLAALPGELNPTGDHRRDPGYCSASVERHLLRGERSHQLLRRSGDDNEDRHWLLFTRA